MVSIYFNFNLVLRFISKGLYDLVHNKTTRRRCFPFLNVSSARRHYLLINFLLVSAVKLRTRYETVEVDRLLQLWAGFNLNV